MGVESSRNGIDANDLGEGWSLVPLGNLVQSLEYGSSAPSRPTGEVPVLRMGNLQAGAIDWTDLVYSSNAVEIRKYLLNPGDVLFNRTNTVELVGKTAYFNGERPAIFAGYLIRVVTAPTKLDAKYLTYVMNTEMARKHSAQVLTIAVGQANINAQKLRTYPIPVPPTAGEQRAIAEALSDVDELITSLDRLIAKMRDVKQGAMQQLLTGKTRLPGFTGSGRLKHTEVGPIPEEWSASPLGSFCSCYSGGTPSTENSRYYGGDIPWITSSDLNDVRVIEVAGRITHEGLANSAAKIVAPQTLLLALYGATSGVCAITEIRAAINQAVLAIVPRGVATQYLFQYLRYRRDFYARTYTQGGQPNFSGEIVKSFVVPVPLLREQSAIADVLSDMDAEIAALEARRDKTKLLKQGMMQELLTGKTRLV